MTPKTKQMVQDLASDFRRWGKRATQRVAKAMKLYKLDVYNIFH